MTWSAGRKGLAPWAARCGLLAVAALTLATGGSVAVALTAPPPRAVDASHQTVKVTATDRLLQQAAMNDLRTLRSELTFEPFLPSGLILPAGNLYNRVTWSSAPVTGFGIFISAQSGAAGSRAIHMDESVMSPADLLDPSFPMNAFRSILRPLRLSNGVWFEMQQQHAPWRGEWILMRVDGNVAIEIDGLSSKQLLAQFAASLVRSA
jgi:hypothetical protein